MSGTSSSTADTWTPTSTRSDYRQTTEHLAQLAGHLQTKNTSPALPSGCLDTCRGVYLTYDSKASFSPKTLCYGHEPPHRMRTAEDVLYPVIRSPVYRVPSPELEKIGIPITVETRTRTGPLKFGPLGTASALVSVLNHPSRFQRNAGQRRVGREARRITQDVASSASHRKDPLPLVSDRENEHGERRVMDGTLVVAGFDKAKRDPAIRQLGSSLNGTLPVLGMEASAANHRLPVSPNRQSGSEKRADRATQAIHNTAKSRPHHRGLCRVARGVGGRRLHVSTHPRCISHRCHVAQLP